MILVFRLYSSHWNLLLRGKKENNDQYIGFVLNYLSFLDLPIITYSSQLLEGRHGRDRMTV